MTVKIYTLAKELNMSSKDLLTKINSMGIEATSHMSSISEDQALKVKKGVSGVKSAEKTKDAPSKKTTSVVKPIIKEESFTKPKPPVGKPIIKEESFNRPKPPVGTPIVPKDFEHRPKKDDIVPEVIKGKKVKEEKPVVKEEKPVVKDEKPVVKEEKPVAKDEKPVVKDEKPAVKDEKPVVKAEAPKEAVKKEKEYVNAPNKPMRFKKVFDSTKQPKEVKKEPHRTETRRPNDTRRPTDNRGPSRPTDNRGPARPTDNRGPARPTDNRGPARPTDNRGPARPTDNRPGANRNFKPGDKPGAPNNNRNQSTDNRRFNNDKDKKPYVKRDDKEGSTLQRMEIKPGQKQNSKLDKTKDKPVNKFAKLEGGAPKKKYFEGRSLEKKVKGKRKGRSKPIEPIEPLIEETLPEGTIIVNVPITIAGFCEQTEISTSKVIMSLMKKGVMATINQNLDEEAVLLLAEELSIDVIIGLSIEAEEEVGIEIFEDKDTDLVSRPPIITVMGHVDHGKTSLLDAIRKTNVTSSESGGITQHIGASEVTIKGQRIVFLDTPGHEAFTAMRARGANVTDIAVLVVAADDSVKPQTIESISHAKAAGVPVIVAINKMDKPGANPEKVKQDLSENGILVEEWGGDVIAVPVSAKSGEGIVSLLEMILLQAEVLELKANPNRLALGTVIEARLDKAKGPIATLLVTNGTINSGESIVAGTSSGRIRLMTNHKGETIKKAGPATAVEILGLTEVPLAGDEFNVTREDKVAREIAEHRKSKQRSEVLARNSSTTLEQLFSQLEEGEVKELGLIIKGDVQGSVGAIVTSLEKLSNDKVKVNIIHTGVGTITESDIMLAGTSNSIVIGFNVRPSTAVVNMAYKDDVEIRTYRVIYDIIDDIEKAMIGMLDPEYKEEVLGKVQIRETFKVPGIGIVAGAYVTEGKVIRNAEVRLVRDGIVIHEGKISSLRRFKDDAKEVNQGYECGIGIENYNDLKIDDTIECFHMVEIER
ncbi:MAG: translation initiation factor IF-2 [Peptostreptococcaceae bacterium]|nr:translation initiation factor IF-2 [Peptostreptococcaceae bacterium]